MMDIAEIRKKAKAREAKGEPVPPETEATADGAICDPSMPAVSDVPAEAVEERHLPEASRGGKALKDSDNDNLDRLFAAVDTFSVAGEDDDSNSSGELQGDRDGTVGRYLTFRLSDEEYGLDIAQISEIIKVRELTEVPRCPDYILGVISLRGVIVPVYDLGRRLKLGASLVQAVSRIIVCKVDDMTVGFLVDSIHQVVNLADAELESPPGGGAGVDRDMVFKIGRHEGRMIILLNLHSVLDFDSV